MATLSHQQVAVKMHGDLCLNPKRFSPAEILEMIPALRDLLHKHQVQGAYLFGSVLQDAAGPLSDLDIAVWPPPALTDWFGYYSDLYEALCGLFQADNIDLVLLNFERRLICQPSDSAYNPGSTSRWQKRVARATMR